VLLACDASLIALLGTCPGIDEVVALKPGLSGFDVHASLMSLPALFKTTLATLPASIPYLAAERKRIAYWHEELQKLGSDGSSLRPRLNIGIAWQVNPRFKAGRKRSIALQQFASLARLDGVRLFSLQKGVGSEQLATVEFPVIDLGNRLESFAETAAVL